MSQTDGRGLASSPVVQGRASLSPGFPAQAPAITLARNSPAGSRGAAAVAAVAAAATAGRFVLGLSAGGALQGHLPHVQAGGGRATRRVDAPHLRASGRCEGPSGLRPEAVGGGRAAASAAPGQPGAAVGLPDDVQALLDKRTAPAREMVQAPGGPGGARTGGKEREAARGARVRELPQV